MTEDQILKLACAFTYSKYEEYCERFDEFEETVDNLSHDLDGGNAFEDLDTLIKEGFLPESFADVDYADLDENSKEYEQINKALVKSYVKYALENDKTAATAVAWILHEYFKDFLD